MSTDATTPTWLESKEATPKIAEHGRSRGQELLISLQRQHFEHAFNLLGQHADCTATDRDGNGPLHLFLQYGTSYKNAYHMIESLLAAGADPNLKNDRGETPLFKYISSNPREFAPLLLDAGADIEAKDNKGQTWLFRMCQIARGEKSLEGLGDYIALGARIDARDFHGRTLLHDTIKSNDAVAYKLRHLVEMGVDPNAIDDSGNTLFHEAILSGHRDIRTIKEIIKLGVNIDQPNNFGRTPIHLLCSIGPHDPIYYEKLQWFFMWVLHESKNIKAKDSDGITPLHLASTIMEYYVAQLLQLGVDPREATLDGLTSLHLATRARQSNIVGMLIFSFSATQNTERLSFINTKDNSGRTALHYACRSGRPETVSLLLSAGADPNIHDALGMTPLDTCIEFEAEQVLWHGFRQVEGEEGVDLWRSNHEYLIGPHVGAVGVTLLDTNRPYVTSGRMITSYFGEKRTKYMNWDHDSVRLEEIFDMMSKSLLETNPDSEMFIGRIRVLIDKCEELGLKYTTSCFRILSSNLRLQEELAQLQHSNLDSCHYERFRETPKLDIKSEWQEECDAWINRRLPCYSEDKNDVKLWFLAKHGLAKLMGAISVQGINKDGIYSKLLHTACVRELPNMAVVKFLIEKLQVDIHTRSQAPELDSNSDSDSETDEDEDEDYKKEAAEMRARQYGDTVLHNLALGYHWWHVAQAIPYLVTQCGADLERKNNAGLTPLVVALRSIGTFHKAAARALLDLGAKIDESYLSDVGDDTELFSSIISTQDIPITAHIFGMAVGSKSLGNLEYLLSIGTDPNLPSKNTTENIPNKCENCAEAIAPPEFYPGCGLYDLKYVGSNTIDELGWEENKALRIAKINMLLGHGANPYAVFRAKIKHPKARMSPLYRFPGTSDEDDSGWESSSLKGDNDNEEYKVGNANEKQAEPKRRRQYGFRSVIHAMLEDGDFVQPILEYPSLNLEHRDPQGRTLLLAACQSRLGADTAIDGMLQDIRSLNYNHESNHYHDPFSDPNAITPLKYLINRGADPLVHDNWGKNALLLLLEAHEVEIDHCRAPPIRRSLNYMISSFPSLLNEPDNQGTYPLHAALQRIRRYEYRGSPDLYSDRFVDVEALLIAGADPFVRDGYGNTILHHLAIGLTEQTGSAAQRKLFHECLNRGVDVNIQNAEGRTAMSLLLDDNGIRAKKRAREWSDNSPIWRIDDEVFGWFDAACMNWGSKDGKGNTLLHIAARHGTWRTGSRIRFLLAKGLDPSVKNLDGKSAVDIARQCENDEALNPMIPSPV